MLENRQPAVVLQVLVEAQAGSALAQDARQCRLANLDRLAPQVRAIQLQQVEAVQKRSCLIATAAQHVEARPCASQHTNSPSIRHERTLTVHRLNHQRETVRPVVAAAGDQPDADRIATRHETIAVVLDLVNPAGSGRRTVGR